ncbi:MAG TPA: hypothetical protein VFX17_00135 [Patescibacteria group bacterium]|nr:hypothetical protein [Patescibacteria group bacterium]
MEKNTKDKEAVYCSCDNCRPGYSMHRHFWLRWLLGLIIIGMVFAVGFKIGEFKGYFDTTFGQPSPVRGNFYRVYQPMVTTPTPAPTDDSSSRAAQ